TWAKGEKNANRWGRARAIAGEGESPFSPPAPPPLRGQAGGVKTSGGRFRVRSAGRRRFRGRPEPHECDRNARNGRRRAGAPARNARGRDGHSSATVPERRRRPAGNKRRWRFADPCGRATSQTRPLPANKPNRLAKRRAGAKKRAGRIRRVESWIASRS